MSLFPHRIETMICRLESSIPSVQTGIIKVGKIERNDWRPVWALCKQIQEEFNGCKDFSSKEAHQAAWQQFQSARSRASSLAEEEKDSFQHQSERLRDEILYVVKNCRYSLLSDVVFFFDETTVEEMKSMSVQLKGAGRKLSEYKRWMLAEHKSQCFEAIQEARESHDLFWAKRRELGEQRHRANEHRRDENEAKRKAWENRTKSNIAKNRDRLSKAENARSHTLDRIRDIEGKLYEATNDKWQGIYSEWLSDAQEKLRDIEESINRTKEWIREDEDRFST